MLLGRVLSAHHTGSEKNFHKRETARTVASYDRAASSRGTRLPLHVATSVSLLRWRDPGLCLVPPSCGRLGLSPFNSRVVARFATESALELV